MGLAGCKRRHANTLSDCVTREGGEGKVNTMVKYQDELRVRGTPVITSSRLKVWWLSSFNGYGVKRVSEIPRASPFGQIRYRRVWTLEPAEDE